jgi:hypothetical protein
MQIVREQFMAARIIVAFADHHFVNLAPSADNELYVPYDDGVRLRADKLRQVCVQADNSLHHAVTPVCAARQSHKSPTITASICFGEY